MFRSQRTVYHWEKTYERNIKAEQQQNPNSNIIEQAKQLVDRVIEK